MIQIKTYNGKPVAAMSREDLIAALTDACQKNAILRQRATRAESELGDQPAYSFAGVAAKAMDRLRGFGRKK